MRTQMLKKCLDEDKLVLKIYLFACYFVNYVMEEEVFKEGLRYQPISCCAAVVWLFL